MKADQYKLLEEIMRISFYLVDTNLYLDTHPTDERALRLHNTFSMQYKELEREYSTKYGPLSPNGMSRLPWEYIESPWPWEIEYHGCKY